MEDFAEGTMGRSLNHGKMLKEIGTMSILLKESLTDTVSIERLDEVG